MPKKLTTNEFIKKANAVHKRKYDYSLVKYEHSQKHVIIVCPIHGKFQQRPSRHIQGDGCFQCGRLKQSISKGYNTYFIEKGKKMCKIKYDYTKVKYRGSHKPVILICPTHGEFEVTPNSHTNGQGCKKCKDTRYYNDDSYREKTKKAIVHHRKNSLKGQLRTMCQSTAVRLEMDKLNHSRFKLLEYTASEYRIHLEKTLPEGVEFENYRQHGYVIDHIIPISIIGDLDTDKITMFRMAMDLRNLRIIKAEENSKKSDTIPKEFMPLLIELQTDYL